MADQAKTVKGIEIVDVAIENARENARENGVQNAEFVLGDMKDTFNDEFLEKSWYAGLYYYRPSPIRYAP